MTRRDVLRTGLLAIAAPLAAVTPAAAMPRLPWHGRPIVDVTQSEWIEPIVVAVYPGAPFTLSWRCERRGNDLSFHYRAKWPRGNFHNRGTGECRVLHTDFFSTPLDKRWSREQMGHERVANAYAEWHEGRPLRMVPWPR